MKNNSITRIFISAVVAQITTSIVMERYDWAFFIALESSFGFTLGWLEGEIHNSNHIKKLIKENMELMGMIKEKEAADD